MPVLNAKRRQGAAIRLADHAEPCEVRVLLSGVAIYPQQVVVKEAVPVEPADKVSPLDLSPSDYNGTWNSDGNFAFELSVKGSNPETAKVKGKVLSIGLPGGSTKFKGNITNATDLNGSFRSKVNAGIVKLKFEFQFSVQLTDATHFEGTVTAVANGFPPITSPTTAEKI